MDSKLVSKELRKRIKPILKGKGFTTSTTRTFWRHKEDRIEVIDFRSTGNILYNLPAASFTVSIGIYFLDYPLNWEVKEKDGILLPKDSECSFRLSLKKDLNQNYNDEAREDTWFIIDENSLNDCIEDAISSLNKYAFPFFEKFENKDEVIRFLIEEDVNFFGGYVGVHGMGSIGSPIRKRETAYFALLYNRKEIALDYLKKVIDEDSEIWINIDDYKKDYKKLKKNL